MKAIIIGSGLSGLTSAAYLAQAGYQVVVYEQYPEIGGVTATLKKAGFSWDLGPLLLEGFAPHEPAGEVLAELGLVDQVKLIQEDRGVSFPDFSLWKPETYAGPYWRKERLKELFPHESQGLDEYYQFYDRMMDLITLARRAERASGITALLLKLRMAVAFQVVKSKLDWNAQQLMDHFFQGPELKALYTAILADFVVRPTQFMGLGIPSVNVETAFDKRIPAKITSAGPRPVYQYIGGGCGELVEAFAEFIRSRGGSIHNNTPVQKISIADGRVTGVVLEDGHFEAADLVIASGGAQEAYFDLIGRENLPEEVIERVENVAFMESVLMVHVGVDIDPGEFQPAALCYYYGTYDIEGGVEKCQGGDYHEGVDGFLIYAPSMHSPEMAPPGHHAITVYTIAPNHLSEGNWNERREELADKLLAEAESVMPGLREHAVVSVVLTPDDFRARTHQKHHSFGGAAPVIGHEGAPYQPPIEGLWFVGAQSEGRGGVANVMAGARKVSQMITKELI
jgi:phytoene dehydrogenase-like protein